MIRACITISVAFLVWTGTASATPRIRTGRACYLILSVTHARVFAFPKLLAVEPNYGLALKEQRLLLREGIPSRIGRTIC